MTYRNDADIHLFFGVIKPKDSIPFDIKDVLPAPFKISRDAIPAFNYSNLIINQNNNNNNNKSASVAWMASHCGTHGNRDGYVRQLKRFIPVDACLKRLKWLKLENCGQDYTVTICVTICSNPSTTNFTCRLKIQSAPITSPKSSSGS